MSDLTTRDVFIMGDFNIDFLDRQNVNTQKIQEFLAQSGSTNLIKKLTHYSANKKNAIDDIYSNSNMVLDCGVLE